MTIKPIPFNADMTKAIWEGRKTTTRRVVKPQPEQYGPGVYDWDWGKVEEAGRPYHAADILYVPEAWRLLEMLGTPARRSRGAKVQFRDGEVMQFHFDDWERIEKWRKYLDKPKDHWQSPYFMPREAARLFLRVTGVRAERLQDIEAAKIEAEGLGREPLDDVGEEFYRGMFSDLWDSTVKPKDRDLYGWAANPWVWVIKFERISREEAEKS